MFALRMMTALTELFEIGSFLAGHEMLFPLPSASRHQWSFASISWEAKPLSRYK
jgi:hypothetical protein